MKLSARILILLAPAAMMVAGCGVNSRTSDEGYATEQMAYDDGTGSGWQKPETVTDNQLPTSTPTEPTTDTTTIVAENGDNSIGEKNVNEGGISEGNAAEENSSAGDVVVTEPGAATEGAVPEAGAEEPVVSLPECPRDPETIDVRAQAVEDPCGQVPVTGVAGDEEARDRKTDSLIPDSEGRKPQEVSRDHLACTLITDNKRELAARVLNVRDGDTIDVQIGDEAFGVRFLGVDTPESYYQGQSQGEPAQKAKKFLRTTLRRDDPVVIELDQQPCDMYGRLLGYVRKGNMDVNQEILRQGWGVNFCIFPNLSRCEQYGRVLEQAQAARRGLFAFDAAVEVPYLWRAKVRGSLGAAAVADLQTHKTVSMQMVEQIPLTHRVLFMSNKQVQAPFHF